MILRPFTAEDLDAMAEVLGDPEVMRFSLSGPYDRKKTADFLSRCIEDYEQRGTGLLAVVLKETGKVIGYCGICYQDVDGEMLPEIGYRLNRSWWGRGLATEAAEASQKYGFEVLGFEKMISIIEEENTGSIRIAEKNGLIYVKDAVFKDKIPVRIYSVALEKGV